MKAKILSVLMLTGVATSLHAEEIKVAKKAAGQQVIENLYGSVETRMTNFRTVDANGDTQSNRQLKLRPQLGTKIMGDKLDLKLATPIVNKQHSAKTERAQPELETNLSLVDNDRLSVDIYSVHYLQTNEAKYDGYLDLDVTLKRNFDRLPFGLVETSLLIEPEANLTTQKIDAEVKRRERPDGLGLTSEQEEAAPVPEQKETDKSINLYPLVYVSPSATPGLKFGLGALILTTYKPKYVQVISDDGATSLKDDGYKVSKATQMRYTVKYQINPDVSVYNQLRQNIAGHFEAGVGKKATSLENRTGITMNLF